jgi:photosystem II stability/assembly factor-like uncharacterized protein
MLAGLKWRDIGPFRGGRVSAVSGAIGQPGVFYAGFPVGGLWKTTGAGTTWAPIMDDIKDASSVGAVAVAPSDPNVIYVGMGDMPTGGSINEGNGLYKSVDAGKTWVHLGLDKSKQIPSILVDPRDPNLVMVACQGDTHAKGGDRGLYRSVDGGKSWTRTLYCDDQTGVVKIAWAFDKPSVMLATTDRHFFGGGGGRGFGFGGGAPDTSGAKGTALFKSTDEGLTWTEIKGGGLPNLSGRTCVAIAQNSDAQRMYLVQNSGLYRSDDGGANWKQMDAADKRVANGQGGYNCGVYVSSSDPDTVYVINTCSYKSTDGGKTFTGFKGAPGGDDPQQMWIDPTNANRMVLGTDQGATVSLDAGQTWSSWYNQPTAQVYHISVDNSFPYWVYATQQDSGAVATRSRGDLGEITPLDWMPTPGYEFGSIVPDPLNPKIVYCGGPSRGIVKITYPTGQWIEVSPVVDNGLQLRQVGNQPMIYNPTNPHELLVGFQYLMASEDGGKSWRRLSPDLGATKEAAKPKAGVAAKKDGFVSEVDEDAGTDTMVSDSDPDEDDDEGDPALQGRGAAGGSIESIAPSCINSGVIWVGTNNGLIQVTQNHGRSWTDVSIPKIPGGERADISSVEADCHDPATAYAVADCHNSGDYAPYVYKTTDFGKTWTPIVNGLPTDQASGSFGRVIKCDTQRPGLLFLGTESSVFVSLDQGGHWQSLGLNLPTTSYRDMVVKDNDLVVGTYGRGFWVLDDISPLRQMAASAGPELYKPADAIRVRRNTGEDTPFPPEVPHALNPPLGAVIYYSLPAQPAGPISMTVSDSSGRVIRHMSSVAAAPLDEPAAPVPDFWLQAAPVLTTDMGLNRTNWDLREDDPPAFNHTYEINANPGQTPASPEGPLVTPGTYTVTLTVDGKAYSQTVMVKNDPRSPSGQRDLDAQHDLQMKLCGGALAAYNDYQQVAAMRAEIKADLANNKSDDFENDAKTFDAKLAAIGGTPSFGFGGFGGRGRGGNTPTFVRINGAFVTQINRADSGDMAPNQPNLKACEDTCKDLKTAETNWHNLLVKDLPAFNQILVKNGYKPLVAMSGESSGG